MSEIMLLGTGRPSFSAGAVTVEVMGNGWDTDGTTSFPATAWNIGNPGIDSGDAGKVAVVVVCTYDVTSGSIPSGVTIGGSAATRQYGTATDTNVDGSVSIWSCVLGGSPTDTVEVTYSPGVQACAYQVYLLSGASGASAHDGGENYVSPAATTNPITDVDQPANGVLIGGWWCPFYTSWAAAGSTRGSITSDFNVDPNDGSTTTSDKQFFAYSDAETSPITGETITVTSNSQRHHHVCATWGP